MGYTSKQPDQLVDSVSDLLSYLPKAIVKFPNFF